MEYSQPMVFGFFRKRKAQPAAPQQEAELAQAVEEAVQTEEVAMQYASETAEQAAAQTPAAEIALVETELTDLATETSAHEPVSIEEADAEVLPAQPEVLAEQSLVETQADKITDAVPTVEVVEHVVAGETSVATA